MTQLNQFMRWFNTKFDFNKYYTCEFIDEDTAAITPIDSITFMTTVVRDIMYIITELNLKIYITADDNKPVIFISMI